MERQQVTAPDSAPPSSPEAIARANHDEALQIATDLRADGRERYDVVDQLRAYGLDEMMAERMIDEVDLIAGMLGRTHPVDINPNVRRRIDAEAVLLPVGNYQPHVRRSTAPAHADGESTAEIMEKRATSSARQLLGDGKNEMEVVQYLESFGCQHDYALAITRQTAEVIRAEFIEAQASRQAAGRKRLFLTIGAMCLVAGVAAAYVLFVR